MAHFAGLNQLMSDFVCPKFKGDIVLEKDHYGQYEQCLQCGYLRDLGRKDELQEQSIRVEKDKKLACAV